MRIPYYKQETKYTCGPACMRMILGSLGIKKSEKYLAKKMRTNKVIGTWNKHIPRVAERYKLDYMVQRHGSLSELKKLYRKGWRIIVYYNTHEDPDCLDRNLAHYSVVKHINWHSIYLLDPSQGPKVRFFCNIFRKRWNAYAEKGWFVAIRKAKKDKYTHIIQ